MANYFYVKSGGSLGVNDDTSFSAEQADSFANIGAANYYDSIAAACSDGTKTTPASDGDFVLVSDQHSKPFDYGSNPTLNSSGSAGGVGLQIVSVDDTDTSVYLPGAGEHLNDGADDWIPKYNGYIAGVDIRADDNLLQFNAIANTSWTIQDATITLGNGTADVLAHLQSDCNLLRLVNCDVVLSGTGNYLTGFLISGCSLIMDGGAISGSAAVNLLGTTNVFASGGGQVLLNGIDMSAQSGTIWETTSAGTTDRALVRLTNCELHASVTLHGTLTAQYHRFEMYNCDNGTADKFYRFYIADGTGSAKNNDTVYVTAGEAWYEGSDHSSIQVDTEALCSHAIPFIFELPAQYVNLAEGTTDTITIDLATAETLVKHDLAAFLVYPDGTTAVTPVWVSSGPSVGTGNYGIDPLDTSTAMPASALGSGDWTGSPGTNRYELVLDTSGTPGQATAVSVRIEVYKASIGPIYIHPLITVSAT